MGETISAAKVAFVCGLWSVRVVVLLSAGPSSCFCIHQLLFPCLEVLVQGASPHHAVGCKVLPGICVDVKCFHVSFADILVAQLWAAFGSLSRCQLSIESRSGLEFSGFSMWHFLKLVVRGFLRVLRFPPLLHRLMVSANKERLK